MSEKEKIVKELLDIYRPLFEGGGYVACETAYAIADYIIARDKKRAGESVSIEMLKKNENYAHIDIDAEFNKAKQWIARTGGRKLTSRFFVNWLNRIEKPLECKRVEQEAF